MSVYHRGQRALERANPEEAKVIREQLKKRPWTVEVELGGNRYVLSSETPVKKDAVGMESMLKALYSTGAEEPLRYLRMGRLTLREVYPYYKKGIGLEPLLSKIRAQEEDATRPKLGVLVKAWYAWLGSSPVSERSKREIAASTAARYRVSMDQLLRFVGSKQLDSAGVEPGDQTEEAIAEAWAPLSPAVFDKALLNAYRESRKAEGRSAATINRDFNTVSGFFTWLESLDEPILFKRPRVVREAEGNERDRCLTPGEWALVSQAFGKLNAGTTQFRGRRSGGTQSEGVVPTRDLWILFETLVLTGLRLGEALALEWGDLDHAQQVIKVARSLERNGDLTNASGATAAKRMQGGRLKTLKSARSVPLGADLAARLKAHGETFTAFGSGPTDRIFPQQVFNQRRMQDLWSRAVAAAGIPHATVHDLRHTFAVHALDSGTQINDLQAILGHSSVHMVMRYVRRQSTKNATESGEAVASVILHGTLP